MTRVPGAVQREAVHCRPGTQSRERVGPGSAAHHFASLRAAPRPGHERACRTRGLAMKLWRIAATAALFVLACGAAVAQTTLRIGLAEDPDILDPTLARP